MKATELDPTTLDVMYETHAQYLRTIQRFNFEVY